MMYRFPYMLGLHTLTVFGGIFQPRVRFLCIRSGISLSVVRCRTHHSRGTLQKRSAP